MNPQDQQKPREWLLSEIIALEEGRVLTVPTHTSGDSIGHAVEVATEFLDEPQIAEVGVGEVGDVCLPAEGDDVIVGYRLDGAPFVLGTRYQVGDTIPEFEPGERVIGHPASSSHIRLATDGTVTISGDGGNTIELAPNGNTIINGGGVKPITQVDFTNETVTRAADVLVPE